MCGKTIYLEMMSTFIADKLPWKSGVFKVARIPFEDLSTRVCEKPKVESTLPTYEICAFACASFKLRWVTDLKAQGSF